MVEVSGNSGELPPEAASGLSAGLGAFKTGYEITTKLFEEGKIEQTIEIVSCGMREAILRTVMDTQEAGIRKELIDLGWTPPKPDPWCA